jgi:hypothetical protein
MKYELWAALLIAVVVFFDAASLKRRGSNVGPSIWAAISFFLGIFGVFLYLGSRSRVFLPQAQKASVSLKRSSQLYQRSTNAPSSSAASSLEEDLDSADADGESTGSIERDEFEQLPDVSFLAEPLLVRAKFNEDGRRVKRSWMLEVVPGAVVCQDLWKTISFPIASENPPKVYENRVDLFLRGSEIRYQIEFAQSADALAFQTAIEKMVLESVRETLEPHRAPAGVALLAPGVVDVDATECSELVYQAPRPFQARVGLQLLSATRGADTVVDFVLESKGDSTGPYFVASGYPIRSRDDLQRDQYRLASYHAELLGLSKAILISLTIYLVFNLVLLARAGNGGSGFLSEIFSGLGESSILSLVLELYGLWPMVMAIALATIRSPKLIGPTGFALLCTPLGMIIVTYLFYAIGIGFWGMPINSTGMSVTDVLVNVGICFYFCTLVHRCWKLRSLSKQLYPASREASASLWSSVSYGLMGGSYLCSLIGIGWHANEMNDQVRYASQPGVDVNREDAALAKLNRGIELFDEKNRDLNLAEKLLQESLVDWQVLGQSELSPLRCRLNLISCLNNLGHLRLLQDREDEAFELFKRSAAISDSVGSRKDLTEVAKGILDYAGTNLEYLEERRSTEATRKKFEEAEKLRVATIIKMDQGKRREALDSLQKLAELWRGMLAGSTEEVRLEANRRLASVHLQMAELQIQENQLELGKASLKASKEYLAEALSKVNADPLLEHYLESARTMDLSIEDFENQQRIRKLFEQGQDAEGIAQWVKYLEDRDAEILKGDRKYSEERVRRHGEHLRDLAWYLLQCDPRFRDPVKALALAERACSLDAELVDFMLALALAKHRNSQWEECLELLDKIQLVAGKIDGMAIFLRALSHHHLHAKDKAEIELQRGLLWTKEILIRAAEDPAVRIYLETFQKDVESLRDEAIQKIQQKPDV